MGRHHKECPMCQTDKEHDGCNCPKCLSDENTKPETKETENDEKITESTVGDYPILSDEQIAKMDMEKVNKMFVILEKRKDILPSIVASMCQTENEYDDEVIFAVNKFVKANNLTDEMANKLKDWKGKPIKIYRKNGMVKNVSVDNVFLSDNEAIPDKVEKKKEKVDTPKEKPIEKEIEKPSETVDEEYERLRKINAEMLKENVENKPEDLIEMERQKKVLENLQTKTEIVKEKVAKKEFKISAKMMSLLDNFSNKIAQGIAWMEIKIAVRLTKKEPTEKTKEMLVDAWTCLIEFYTEMDVEQFLKYLPVIYLIVAHISFIMEILPEKEQKELEEIINSDARKQQMDLPTPTNEVKEIITKPKNIADEFKSKKKDTKVWDKNIVINYGK
jgi:hypothetical protein